MSSRQEEKEKRRRERLEREQAEKAASARRKRLQLVFGVVLAVLALGGGIAAVAFGVFGGDSGEPRQVAEGGADIPAVVEGDVTKASEAAGCKYEPKVPNEGAGHEEKEFQASDYKHNPPTSGNHFPQWSDDGIYGPGQSDDLGKLVHTLEHGRINLQYKPGTSAQVIAQLETLYNEMDGGYHLLLYENPTGMTHAVAATAWDAALGCPAMNDKVFDAIRAFTKEHIDKGPEKVP
jgi:hypothetical protein